MSKGTIASILIDAKEKEHFDHVEFKTAVLTSAVEQGWTEEEFTVAFAQFMAAKHYREKKNMRKHKQVKTNPLLQKLMRRL